MSLRGRKCLLCQGAQIVWDQLNYWSVFDLFLSVYSCLLTLRGSLHAKERLCPLKLKNGKKLTEQKRPLVQYYSHPPSESIIPPYSLTNKTHIAKSLKIQKPLLKKRAAFWQKLRLMALGLLQSSPKSGITFIWIDIYRTVIFRSIPDLNIDRTRPVVHPEISVWHWKEKATLWACLFSPTFLPCWPKRKNRYIHTHAFVHTHRAETTERKDLQVACKENGTVPGMLSNFRRSSSFSCCSEITSCSSSWHLGQ